MNKVIVSGKPGGGELTLSRKLSAETGIKLCTLDLIEYKKMVSVFHLKSIQKNMPL